MIDAERIAAFRDRQDAALRNVHVVCHWAFGKFKIDGMSSKWKLIESYPLDGDGYPTQGTHEGKRRGEEPWMDFLFKKDDDPEGYGDRQPIMGRAVTMWGLGSGVTLHGFHPPEWVKWIAPGFYEKIGLLPHWEQYFEEGFTLYFGTQNEIHKYLRDRPEKLGEELTDFANLSPGLYRIHWKTGGYSLASVGITHDGSRWMAPCNWTSENNEDPHVVRTDWDGVTKVVLVEKK